MLEDHGHGLVWFERHRHRRRKSCSLHVVLEMLLQLKATIVNPERFSARVRLGVRVEAVRLLAVHKCARTSGN